MKNSLVKLFASGFYSSYSPFIPGTTGTVPAWLIVFFLLGPTAYAVPIAAIVMTIISIWLSGVAEAVYGHDAKKIVVDEWAGMFIAVALVPYSLPNYIMAFIFFRGFDWFKIYPANVAERLPRGWGVTADDVVAGIQANLLTHLAIYVNNAYLNIF